MLQRAASNAYSWWWASHIRTKQSKWLDNNLQEMEEKVKSALDLIEEDADTFAKKAEMYYQRRPELINFIRESYRSYRALAERYDHLSGELHKANNTIATVCPEQVHFGIEEEEDIPSESGKSDAKKVEKVLSRNQQISLKRSIKTSSTQTLPQHRSTSSQKSVDQTQEEIDKLQKGILALQTEKEFVKSSYESRLAKYLDIEKRITEMQERLSSLQDEYSASIIEDDDARALMIATALRSCEDTLVKLHEQQKRSTEDARFESQRIKSASEKLKALKCNDGHFKVNIQDSSVYASKEPSSADDISGNEAAIFDQERIELNPLYETVRNNLKNTSEMSAIDLAEKIDGLVNKVISLETTVSSQTAQIERLRHETDGFYKYLQTLEEEKSLTVDSQVSDEKLRRAEEEFHVIQELDKSIREEGDKLKTHFMEIYHTFHDLSNRLQCPGQNTDPKDIDSASTDVKSECIGKESLNLPETENSENKPEEETRGTKGKDATVHGATDNFHEQQNKQKIGDEEQQENDPAPSELNQVNGEVVTTATSHKSQECPDDGKKLHESKDQDEGSLPSWQQLFLDGLEDREKILLAEYTSVLRKYRETRQKLAEADKKHQDHVFQTVAQMRDLRNAFVMKDEENRCLRKKLSFLESGRKRGSFVIAETAASDSSQSTALPSMVPDLPNSKTSVDLADSRKEGCKRLLDLIGEQYDVLPIEERFRRDIDNLLDENLDFWLRFSSSFQQIQMYRLTIEKLKAEIMKLNNDHPSSDTGEQSTKPEPSLIHKQLKELQTDFSIWIEQNALLKEELQRRCCSLSDVSEEITRASKERKEGDEFQFTTYRAAKFKGEVVNMQQENNKVAKELQAGLEQVRGLQSVLEKALAKLNESLEMPTAPRADDQQHSPNLSGRAKIPLRSFLFGVKPKSKKSSIFSCMNHALQKQYIDLRPGLPS